MFQYFSQNDARVLQNKLISVLAKWGNGDMSAEFSCHYPWPVNLDLVTETLGSLLLPEEIKLLYEHEWKCETRKIDEEKYIVIFVR